MHSPQTAAATGLKSLSYNCVATVVADLDRSVNWYVEVLGFRDAVRLEIDGASVALLDGAAGHLELIQRDRPSFATEPSLFAEPPDHLAPLGNKFLVFDVDDLAVASDELAAAGVTVLWREKELAPGFRSTAIRDIDGNFIHIFQKRTDSTGEHHA